MWRRRRYVIFLITQFDDNCKVFIEVHVTVSVTENFLPEIHILFKKKSAIAINTKTTKNLIDDRNI